jgi:hypothetical protein
MALQLTLVVMGPGSRPGRREWSCLANLFSNRRDSFRSSLRALAKQSMRQQGRKHRLLRRFTPRNDVRMCLRIPAARRAPGCCLIGSPWKNEGVGNAGCPLHPQSRVRNKTKHTSVVTTGSPESPGIPARNGFNGFLRALPGDRACLPPSPLRSLLLKSLTPASGRQDHTTSPSAGRRSRQQRRLRPPHPVPNVRDDRETPLLWDGMTGCCR